ncbi:MAG: hypothetical protein AAFN74_23555, partial [Myxococcota bacterium]
MAQRLLLIDSFGRKTKRKNETMINHAPEIPASRDDLERTRRDVEAFALVQHDEDGDRLPHNWIT